MDRVAAPVLFNRRETASVWRLGLAYDALARRPRAARFVMLSFPDPAQQLVPRPFSISDVWRADDGAVVCEFLYKPVGRVTRMLCGLGEGDTMAVLGLLGNGYPPPPDGRRPVLLAGGIGNAPFAYHVRELVSGPAREDPARVLLLLAGRTAEDVWIQDAVRGSGITVCEVTEDGSRGERGLVTDALLRRLPDLGPVELYACGPAPMLRAVSELAGARGLRCWLAVEERMACGFGVCNACVVERRVEGVPRGAGPYLKSCTEGPVFEAREIHA